MSEEGERQSTEMSGPATAKYEKEVRILSQTLVLMVTPAEEVYVDAAAELIQEKLEEYRERYKVKDDLHLLSMACLAVAVDHFRHVQEHQQFRQDLGHRILGLHAALDVTLDQLPPPPTGSTTGSQ